MNKVLRPLGLVFSAILGIGFGLFFGIIASWLITAGLLGYGDSGPAWVLAMHILITFVSIILFVIIFTRPYYKNMKSKPDE